MIKEFPKIMRTHWNAVLISVSIIFCLINIAIFYPGYMSNDSLNQLKQATGVLEVIDLTPVAMTLMWRSLIFITGYTSSMLIFQLSMLWFFLALLAIYVYKETKSRKFSFIILSIGLLPVVLNISGVIWKDNQMTFALCLALMSVLYFKSINNRAYRITLLIFSLALVVYACLVRYNAVFAIIPIIFLIIRESGLVGKVRFQIISTLLICITIGGLFLVVNKVMDAQKSNPVVAVMLDDIVNVSNKEDIQNLSIHSDSTESLIRVTECAVEKNVLLNNFWVCANDNDRKVLQYVRSTEIKNTWMKRVLEAPMSYVLYRTETFLTFLFPPVDAYFIWQDGIVANDIGQEVKYDRLGNIVSIYINNWAYKYFSFLFEAWFWLMVNIIILFSIRRNIKDNSIVFAILISSVLYILSYLPTGATVDYRYIYWPVFATIISVILLLVKYWDSKFIYLSLARLSQSK